MVKNEKSKILIVEDHPIFSMGLRELINQEDDLTVCGQAESVQEARKILMSLNPDLVIVDLSLKDSSGFDLIQDIGSRSGGRIPVLVLSMHDESLHAQRCLKAGARGYIMKQEASVSVVKAIRRILKGYLYVSEKVSSRLLETVVKHPDAMHESPLNHLTNRELEIFQMIGRGLYPGEIADRLHLSTKTVGTYRERIKAKLGFSHGMDLVRYAVIWVEQGIIPSKKI
ncbi:MAG: response regulator transcription factor [Deltaproteobacteria bacterium]|nr:response regulator transcription factor [Deltaproteobacteria bacterium]